MSARASRILNFIMAGTLACLPAVGHSQKKQKKKTPELRVENYFGGLFLIGDGGLPNGPCFRIHGRVSAGDFFNNLKSFDSDEGVIFRRGTNEVTEFPEKLYLAFSLRDQPCDYGLQPAAPGVYLTRQEVSDMRLTLYWKSGVDLRPAEKIVMVNSSVDRIEPYAKNLENELPERYLWTYELGIPAAGVPLTDSLVLVFRNAEGRIVARVAARL